MSADILRRAAEVEWRAIPGFPGYEASNDGHVRTLRPYGGVLRVLSEWPNPQGYLTVQLGPRGKRTRVTVHRMVMLAFVGPRPPGKEIAHWDGDKTNNALTNLRYATPKENAQDTLRLGAHGHARLTHCKRGHEFSGDNLLLRRDRPGRECRTCRRIAKKAWQARAAS
jgi:NUMOD4 motif./HNH endonuclease.